MDIIFYLIVLAGLFYLTYLTFQYVERKLLAFKETRAARLTIEKAGRLLQQSRYNQADALMTGHKEKVIKKYVRIKTEYVRGLFAGTQYEHDEEKILAICNLKKNFLLRARAGSGKTATIILKIRLLLSKYDVSEKNILVLAFNRKAARELEECVQQFHPRFSSAMTFHGFAYQTLQPLAKIIDGNERRVFLGRIIERLQEQHNDALYNFFSETNYLQINENSISLNGNFVKSKGERWIADFLFSCGIRYQYERPYRWQGIYRPDFTIFTPDKIIILEHWGVDIHASNHSADEKRYIQQMHEKIAYWNRKKSKYVLLQTSIADMRRGRDDFESHLAGLLRPFVGVNKLAKAEVMSAVLPKISARLLRLVDTAMFIVDGKNAGAPLREANPLLAFCNAVYSSYIQAKRADNILDFNDLLTGAKHKIEKGDAFFWSRNKKYQSHIRQLKYIFIDEYQDFSPLFDVVTNAICMQNEEVNLFCVGDNCQAINGFAGSDLRLFNNFLNRIGNSDAGILKTNYRSDQEIVALGNNILQLSTDERSESNSDGCGSIMLGFVDKIRIEKDSPFLIEEDYRNLYIPSQYAIAICDIILQHQGQSIYLLHRKNHFYGMDINTFHKKIIALLKRLAPDFSTNNVEAMTVHKSKGKEAEVVILFDATDRNFPLVHPDQKLLGEYARSEADIIAEEKHLFYVACTRAKRALYILSTKSEQSRFIRNHLEGRDYKPEVASYVNRVEEDACVEAGRKDK